MNVFDSEVDQQKKSLVSGDGRQTVTPFKKDLEMTAEFGYQVGACQVLLRGVEAEQRLLRW